MIPRKGATLLEVLVAIGIVAILVGLLLPAILKVRSAAVAVKERNNMRQVVLATHHYASANNGELPSATDDRRAFVLRALLPYLEVAGPCDYWVPPFGLYHAVVPIFVSQTDPTLGYAPQCFERDGPSSIAVNATAFDGSPSLAASFSDGTSNTIGLGEHYFYTWNRNNRISYSGYGLPTFPGATYDGARSANFAERRREDVYPITEGNPPQSRSSIPGMTFQVAPKFEESDGRLLQAMQLSGLKVAMMDGSVRTIAPGVSERIFWAAVTPAGGEVAGLD